MFAEQLSSREQSWCFCLTPWHRHVLWNRFLLIMYVGQRGNSLKKNALGWGTKLLRGEFIQKYERKIFHLGSAHSYTCKNTDVMGLGPQIWSLCDLLAWSCSTVTDKTLSFPADSFMYLFSVEEWICISHKWKPKQKLEKRFHLLPSWEHKRLLYLQRALHHWNPLLFLTFDFFKC